MPTAVTISPVERLRRAGKPLTIENLLAEVDLDIAAENDDERIRQTFEQRLRAARQARDLTQEALGELVTVRDKEINRWEHASTWGTMPSRASRRRLARALDVPFNYLWPEAEL